MRIDLPRLLEALRTEMFFGSIPRWQAEPVERLIGEGLRRGRSLEDIAYVLATGYHETSRWRYRREIGRGKGRIYGEDVLVYRNQREIYFGRGDGQLTWLMNYARMSVRLTLELGREIDLVNNPALAEQPEYSALILWEGMVDGLFTGAGLADFIRPGSVDYVRARRIVNGNDKAELIAGHARKFESCLRGAVLTKEAA